MKFWNFKESEEEIELRIEGEIIDDDDSWIYDWFGIVNSAPKTFRDELNKYAGKDISLWIDSYGGSVFAGASIYNSLKSHKGKVTVKVNKAMSAASVIAMAADELLMSPVGVMMIHNPWVGVSGDMHTLRKTADVLDVVKDTIMNAYTLKTGKTKDEISEMMDVETYMSATVAQKEGFADGVLFTDESSDINNMVYNRAQIMNSARNSIDKFLELRKKFETEDTGSEKAKAIEIQKAKLALELVI